MKSNPKSVRLSERVLRYIESYRGSTFSEKLEHYVLDTEERREQLVFEWERLNAEIQDKRRELGDLRERIRQVRVADQRFAALVDALDKLLDT